MAEQQSQLIYQKLIGKARESEEPVTEIDEVGEHRTIYRAAQVDGEAVWRADIDTLDEREEFDATTRVSFAKCYPEAEYRTMRDWSPLATGSLSGPQTLEAWEALFTVFNAALDLYNQEGRK